MTRIPAAIAALLALAGSLPASALLPLEGIAQVATGASHTCVLTTSGGVKCWGYNGQGQLGDGTLTERLIPVDVVGLASGVASISAGLYHTCAVTTNGGVRCWGQVSSGAPASFGDYRTPVEIAGLSTGVAAVAAGGFGGLTCVLTTAGAVKCWGFNAGGVNDSLTPADVAGLSGVTAIATGESHSCALTTGGAVKCWGRNSYGQLGDNSTTDRMTPVDVVGLSSGVGAISAGSGQTCAVTSQGGVKCWGSNYSGELGDGGAAASRLVPVDVSGLSSGASAVSAGRYSTCAITTGGGARCWGDNLSGQLGDGTTAHRAIPVNVSGLASGVAGISVAASHACARTTGGGLKCWGNNAAGILGINSTESPRPVPGDVSTLASGASSASAGGVHTCALTGGGGVKCWGRNSYGQLGDGTGFDRAAAVDASGLPSGVTRVSSGYAHTCAVATGGGVKCWGANEKGQLGDGSTVARTAAVDVSGLQSGVTAVALGRAHTCALTSGGGIKCWGDNWTGQLGDGGGAETRSTPTDVAGLASGVMAITAGGDHTCALTSGGAVWCWGSDYSGELGNGPPVSPYSYSPSPVEGLSSGVVAIAAGNVHTCAVMAGGGVKCWGALFALGQVDFAFPSHHIPVDVAGVAGATAITAGDAHTCVRTGSGGLKCWGDNSHGQVGDGTSASHPVPVTVLVVGARITSSPSSTSNLTAPTFHFSVAGTGTVECSLDGAAFASCTSPVTLSGLGPGAHTFRVRARDGQGNPDPEPATHSWTIATALLSASAPSLAFGSQSMNTTSPAIALTLTNPTAGPITVTSSTATSGFAVAGNTCATVAAGGTCQVIVTFTPATQGPVVGSLQIHYAGGATVVDLAGSGEKSLVTHYYNSILGRAPDGGGKAFWETEATRVAGLGANVNETWYAMAQAFFFSAEYAARARDNAGFVTDLYRTFFNRAPDEGGLAHWSGQLAAGLPREVLLAEFMFSFEFRNFATALFGFYFVRPEIDVVMDFYRGLLLRLPDTQGFNFWLQRFRAAQCAAIPAVVGFPHPVATEVEAMSSLFATSAEYLGRNRSNAQYVGDLYNAFLRRGGDLTGVQFWIAEITSGRKTREQLRRAFLESSEFNFRVQAIAAAGCMQ